MVEQSCTPEQHEHEREHPDEAAAQAFVAAHSGHFRHPAVDPPPYHCPGCARWWSARVSRDHTGEHPYPTRRAAEEGLLERSAAIPRLADVRPYHCLPCDTWYTPGDIPVTCPEHGPRQMFATAEEAMRHLAQRFGRTPEHFAKVPHQCRQCGEFYLPPRVCMRHTTKLWFPSWVEADAAAARKTLAYPQEPTRAYPCEHCGQFHLTTEPLVSKRS